MMHRRGFVAVLALACASCQGNVGAADPGPVGAAKVAFPQLVFDKPLFLTAAPGNSRHLFVVTQGGKIHVFENRADVSSTGIFLDVSARLRSGGEEGLLGLAFHPQYADNGMFYVYYTARENPRRSVLSSFRVSADPLVADAKSETVLLEIPQPFSNHNGGMLAFGPDGKLYVAVGDGGSGGDPQNHGQRLDTVLGAILRLEPDGRVPADNPFVGEPGARGEVWAFGLRNPWRFSFDRKTGELWAGDVGQNAFEEVDIIQKGGNYGWRVYEGNAPFENPDARPRAEFVAPLITYGRRRGCSITGGYVYRGSRLPQLFGRYFYSDFCSGRLWALTADGGVLVSNEQVGSVPNPSSFGEDSAGELYITSFDGRIYTLAPP